MHAELSERSFPLEIKEKEIAVELICNSFAYHESINAIKENNKGKNLTTGKSHPPTFSANDVEKRLRNIDS